MLVPPTFALRDYGLASQARETDGDGAPSLPKALASLPRYSASLRLPTLGYTVDSFAPAQLPLRANLRLVYLTTAPALDCLTLGICAIARVISAALRLPPYCGCPPWATLLTFP